MRWKGMLLAVALLAVACGDDGTAATTATTTTVLTVVTGASGMDDVPSVEVWVPWHQRGTFDPLDQDPAECFAERDLGDGGIAGDGLGDNGLNEGEIIVDFDLAVDRAVPDDPGAGDGTADLTVLADSWLVADDLPPLETGGAVDRLDVDPGTLVLHPATDFEPTHLAIEADEILRTIEWLADRDDVSLVAISFAARDELRADFGDGERTGVVAAGWAVIGDDLVSFTGCASVEDLAVVLAGVGTEGTAIVTDEIDEADETDFVAALTAFAGSRDAVLESMGIGSDAFRFEACAAPNPGVIPRLGFGGTDVAIAWGSAADHSSGRLDIADWTILAADEHDPATRVEAGVPDSWPGDLWFVTFDASDTEPAAALLAGVDPDLGLYLGTSMTASWEPLCDFARDVLAFAEFLAGIEPDRERWDLPDGEAGDEQVIIDTLLAIRDDAAARQKYLDWTPCTYKLCVPDGVAPPRGG